MVPIPVEKNLSSVTYHQIVDEFWYAWYLDLRIIINKSTGYVNATKLCDEHGKRFRDWTRGRQTQELISVFIKSIAPSGEEKSDRAESRGRSYWSTLEHGGDNIHNLIISGTYIHPDLVPALAMWLSPLFFLKACKILNDYITEEWKHNHGTLVKNLEDYEKRLQSMATFADDVSNMLLQLSPDVAPKSISLDLLEIFMLLKLNDPQYKFQYTTTRCQKRNMKKAIKRVMEKHPKAITLLEIGYTPNARNLQNRFKESLDETEDVKMVGNDIAVEDVDTDLESMLVNRIKDIATSFV